MSVSKSDKNRTTKNRTVQINNPEEKNSDLHNLLPKNKHFIINSRKGKSG